MAKFVLVHPAWFGGWCWARVSPLLTSAGHQVWTPTLTGLGEREHLVRRDVGLDTHVQDIVNVLEFEDMAEVVLVGNSSAGAVITGVANRTPERVAHLIYLDAFVPEDGQSLFDLVPPDRRPVFEALVRDEGDGWLVPRFAPPPWETFVANAWQITDPVDIAWVVPRLRPTPLKHFTDPLRLDRPGTAPHRTYIRCSGFPHPGFDRYANVARDSESWSLVEMPTSHVPYVTNPEALADTLRAAVS